MRCKSCNRIYTPAIVYKLNEQGQTVFDRFEELCIDCAWESQQEYTAEDILGCNGDYVQEILNSSCN